MSLKVFRLNLTDLTLADEDSSSININNDTDTADNSDLRKNAKMRMVRNEDGRERRMMMRSFYGKSVGGNLRNEAAKLVSATTEGEADIMMTNMLMMLMISLGPKKWIWVCAI